MRPGSQLEAPTHLGSKDLGLPPEWLDDEELSGNEIVTSAVRGGRAVQAAAPTSYSHHSFSAKPLSAFPAPVVVAEAGAKSVARVRTESSSNALPAQHSRSVSHSDSQEAASEAARRARRAERKAARKARKEDKKEAKSVAVEKSVAAASEGKEKSVSAKSVSAPAAAAAEQPARPSQPEMIAPGITALDPLAVPVPPELGPTIYGWVRRLALQADLAGADRVLRDALLDLSSSLSCTIVYPGQEGLWSLGSDDEIPRDAQPLIACATARRAVVSSHSAIIPVLTTSETVAVITMTRNPRNPAYHPVEQIAMIALAREAAAILHHLAIAHLQKQSEINADKGGLYRGEALEAHRSRGNEGVPVHLTPSWVRRTYPILGIAILIALVASIFITVPTYSTGHGIVLFPGTAVSAPFPGTVTEVRAVPGQPKKKGDILLVLNAANELAELALAKEEYRAATIQYLNDRNDESIKKSINSASTRVDRAKAQLETRYIRAPKDGVVLDVRVEKSKPVQIGEKFLTLVEPGTTPESVCFLPASDASRIKPEHKLDISQLGYTKSPDHVEITKIGREGISVQEISKYVGIEYAGSLEKRLQAGTWVMVRARLPGTFTTDRKTHRHLQGMDLGCEIRIQNKPFLATLLPALEKYLGEAD